MQRFLSCLIFFSAFNWDKEKGGGGAVKLSCSWVNVEGEQT